MSVTVVSQQVVRLRAAVLLATLVVVPLVAALGTSPSRWFAVKTADQQVAGTASGAHEQREPKANDTHPHDDSPKSSTAPADSRQLDAQAGNRVADQTPQPMDDNPVLRRWAQDESPSGSPVDVDPPVATPRASAGAPPSQFGRIEQQLRGWGATYYKLEHWSNQGSLYRFHCRMSIGGLKHYNRHFEAVADDPVAAMHDVLEQVRAWRTPLIERPTT
jgi:hypothetical protein